MPQIPPDGLLIYGSGLVFGGNVYPVWMVDGVPMQAAAGAQQAGQQGQSMAQKPVKAPGQQLQKQQQQQQHQLQSAMGVHYDYGYTTQGSDIEGWSGYVMMSPADANKPYSFGWSATDWG
ncbi:uncharacterized protein LOC117584542 isoform X2 [Drosophila guanche]|uniref:uncharacterized protein LOC117584542 isoform X2 n=1 Tax=Drosophila guanche TaxID=7266 RepID=UPI00147196E7|nr:uncharacterized protein LOC117584542 isoform X2 [Drosophila guanche]